MKHPAEDDAPEQESSSPNISELLAYFNAENGHN